MSNLEESSDKKRRESTEGRTTNETKIKTTLNLEDLGAGYDPNDKRLIKAISFYEEKLLPFIKENHGVFKNSNFLILKGYGTDLTKQRRSPDESLADRRPEKYRRH